MVPVGRLNLLADKTRFLAAVGGVAFAVTLILMVQALYAGYSRSVADFIKALPVDVWVGQAGAFDLYRSTTMLPSDRVRQIQSIDGVRAVGQLRARQVAFETERGDVTTLLLAFDAGPFSSQIADALGMASLPDGGRIAISEYVHRHGGIGKGDPMTINGLPLRVADRVGVTSPPFGSFSVISFQDAEAVFSMQGTVSYFLVTAEDARDANRIAAEIEEGLPGTSAYTREQFAASNGRTVKEFLPVVAVLLVVSYLVGIIVVSLTIYTATVEKTRDYGVLKAIGASNWYVYSIVVYQSFVVSLTGFLIGLPFAILTSQIAEQRVTEFITTYSWEGISQAFIAVLVMSAISALLPARRLGGIDPAMVFRA